MGPGLGLQHGVADADAQPHPVLRGPLAVLQQAAVLLVLQKHVHEHGAGGDDEIVVQAAAEYGGLHPLGQGVHPLLELVLIADLLPFPEEQVVLVIKEVVEVNGNDR